MRKPLPTRTAVLDILSEQGGPVHAREIAERLGVGPESFEGLLRVLDALVYEGSVTARGQRFQLDLPGHDGDGPRLGKPRRGKGGELRDGLLNVNPRGFGFVASPTASGDDVFIPAEALGGALHGDTVTIEIVGRGPRGAEGRIVEVKKRGKIRVSGVLRRRGKSAWLEPDDPRVRGPIVLSSEIDQRGGEGNSGEDGQVVVVQVTRFPENPEENPEGKILAVLGAPGELQVETRKILFLEQIEEVHSDEAIAEAEAYGLEVPAEMLEGREDLTHVPLPTIDPEDARDHDDAVWVKRTAKGGYELWVAIADVSSYVRPETKLDDEAKTRGCSIYLPDRAIPMLPRALSSNLCSLLPDVIRLCLCVHAELDAKGEVISSRLVRGYMKSAAKLTYGGVAKALGFTDKPAKQEKAEAMVEDLRVAYELSRTLRGRRMKRGALDFDLPEAVVKLDADGKPISISKRSTDPGMKKAYQLIEELMIFANELVARWLLQHQLPGIYRVHLPPDPKKLDRLANMCQLLGLEFDVEATQTPKGLSDILKAFSEHESSTVLNSLLLRSMKQATYDVANLGHFGLASEAYLHFTSPIRRYPDLVVHRIVHAALEDAKTRKQALATFANPETLTEAATASSFAERRAMEIERATVDIYRCFYMIDHIGERFEGSVSAFVGSGAFVQLDEPFLDVLVRTEDLGPDFKIEEDGLMATSGRSGDAIRLGDRVVVEIMDCAILRRAVYGWIVAGEGRRGRAPSGRSERPGRRGRDERPAEDARPARPGRDVRRGGPSTDARRTDDRGPARGKRGRSDERDARTTSGRSAPAKGGTFGKPGKPGRPAKPSKAGRPAKPGKPGKPGKTFGKAKKQKPGRRR